MDEAAGENSKLKVQSAKPQCKMQKEFVVPFGFAQGRLRSLFIVRCEGGRLGRVFWIDFSARPGGLGRNDNEVAGLRSK